MLFRSGYQLPLLEANVKYINAAVYDDLLEIEAVNKILYSAKVKIEYNIRRHETGELLCTGYTEHIFINKDTKKATRPPKVYIDTLAPFFKE